MELDGITFQSGGMKDLRILPVTTLPTNISEGTLVNHNGEWKRFSGAVGVWERTIAAAAGQVAFTTPGSYSWTCPVGVTSVCVVAVGGGGGGTWFNQASLRILAMNGGAGGGLGWKNHIPVVPGQTYAVVVGAGGPNLEYPVNPRGIGGASYFINQSTVAGLGGEGGAYASNCNGGEFVGEGGGAGGNVVFSINSNTTGRGPSAGGGAGGYTGKGGGSISSTNYSSASGGGGGAGNMGSNYYSGGGGGTGLVGQGSNGSTGATNNGGSGGGNGTDNGNGQGGFPGGGGGGSSTLAHGKGGKGGDGAVRIIWGEGRVFPFINTTDV